MTTAPVRVVFDLDGTLVESLGSLADAGARLMVEMGRTPVPTPDFAQFVGRGVAALVADLLAATGGLPEGGSDAALARFMALYAENPVGGVEEYPGARAALLALADQGCGLGVCTQKPVAQAEQILHALGLMPPITSLVGGGTLPGVLKPDPQMLMHAAAPLGDGPLIYVGDSGVDAKTAENAGVPFILTEWGYRSEAPSALRHQGLLTSFADLPAMVARIAAA